MKKVIFLVLALALAACKTTEDPANTRAVVTVAGTIIGAIVGYGLGNGSGQAIMTVLGAAAGGAGGYYAADYIIRKDQEKMSRAAYQGLEHTPVGGTVYWQNRDTGSAGSFTMLRTFATADGRECREIVAHLMGHLNTLKQRHTACRIFNGAWEFS